MSEQPEFFTYTRDEFIGEFVPPRRPRGCGGSPAERALQVRAEYLTEMRKKAGMTQAEVAAAMGYPSSASRRSKAAPWQNSQLWPTTSEPRRRLKVIADFGDSWRVWPDY